MYTSTHRTTHRAPWGRATAAVAAAAAAATGVALSSNSYAGPVFVDSFNSSGNGNGQLPFRSLTGITVNDVLDDLYVADGLFSTIQIFDRNGNYKSSFGSFGTSNGQFSVPWGVAVLNKVPSVPSRANAEVFVADKNNRRVEVFDGNGAYLRQFNNGGNFGEIRGISIESSGVLAVADPENNRVTTHGYITGNLISTITGADFFPQSPMNFPTEVHIANGRVAIADTNDNQVQVYGAISGTPPSPKFGSGGSGDGQFQVPQGISRGPSGRIYVSDTQQHRIQVFASNGAFISKFGTGAAGAGPGQFNQPLQLSVSSSGLIFIIDSNNDRVQRWFEPVEWTTPYTHNVAAVALDQNLGLANGFNLHVIGQTAVNAATLNLNGGQFTTGSLLLNNGAFVSGVSTNLAGPVQLQAGDGTFSPAAGQDVTLAGAVSGAGRLVKAGAGRLILSTANSYTGGTDVDAGTLLVDAAVGSATGSGIVTVLDGARIGGAGNVGGLTSVQSGGIVSPGLSPGTITFSSLGLLDSSVIEMELGTAGADKIVVNGGLFSQPGLIRVNVTDAGGLGPNQTYVLVDFGGAVSPNADASRFVLDSSPVAGTFSRSNNQILFTTVPEPVVILPLGCVVLTTRARRGARSRPL